MAKKTNYIFPVQFTIEVWCVSVVHTFYTLLSLGELTYAVLHSLVLRGLDRLYVYWDQ